MSHHQTAVLYPSDSLVLRPKRSSVVDTLRMRWAQVAELASSRGWMSVVKEMIFFHRAAIVVEKDLAEIKERPEVLEGLKLKVVEFDEKMLSSGSYDFAVRSRGLKAAHYLDGGYGGFALVRDHRIVGDTWYVPPRAIDNPALLHNDLRILGFTSWPENHVYTFDIFVAPEERKGKAAPAFQNEAMLRLRAKGYTKAFGFYWADNIPAHWCTRVTNKWKKLREVRVSRFFTLKRSTLLPTIAKYRKAALMPDISLR